MAPLLQSLESFLRLLVVLGQVVSRAVFLSSLAVAAVLLLGTAAILRLPAVRGFAANTIERVAFRIDPPRTIVLEGQLICRDCELQRMYGARAMCARKGHHGALETADGKIWNLMENETSDALIHNEALRGKTVRIRGRIYRQAGCIEVESYEVLQPAAMDRGWAHWPRRPGAPV